MEKNKVLSLTDKEGVHLFSFAFSNPLRVEILRLLSTDSMSISELSKRLKVPLTTVSSSISVLEKSGLISTIVQAGKHGSMKLCSLVYETVTIGLVKSVNETLGNSVVFDIPLGSFFSVDIQPTCGMASETSFLGRDDDVETFYKPNRFEAQLLWFYKGFVEYRIPIDKSKEVLSLELTMEACSEAPNYRLEWPSDITVLINDNEIGTWVCPGDFGGSRGKFTPLWWPINSTQFGLLKNWKVDGEGSYIDFKRSSNVDIKMISASSHDYISIKIGIKDDAQNIGGINLFGKKFGNFGCGLSAKITYK